MKSSLVLKQIRTKRQSDKYISSAEYKINEKLTKSSKSKSEITRVFTRESFAQITRKARVFLQSSTTNRIYLHLYLFHWSDVKSRSKILNGISKTF